MPDGRCGGHGPPQKLPTQPWWCQRVQAEPTLAMPDRYILINEISNIHTFELEITRTICYNAKEVAI